MTFTAEDRAKVGKYAVENGVARVQKHFKQLNLSESTVCYFKKKHLNERSKCAKAGDLSEVTKVHVVKQGQKVPIVCETHMPNQHSAVTTE